MMRSGERGVSQLEVLVALAVMTVIVVMLGNSFGFLRRGLDRLGTNNYEISAAVARNRFREFGADMGTKFGDGSARDLLNGDRSSLTFTSFDHSVDANEPQPVTITLSLQPSQDLKAVIAQTSSADTKEELETKLVLASRATSLTIAYFGLTSDNDQPAWYDAWDDPKRLPDLVKIEITDDAGKLSPPIVFEPAKKERQSQISLSSLLPPD